MAPITILEHGGLILNGAYSCVCSIISICYLVACFCLSSTWTGLSFITDYSYIVIVDYTYPLLTKTVSMSFNLLCWMFWGTYTVIQYWLYGTCNVIQFMFSAMFSWYFLLFAVLGMGILLQHKPYRVILTDYFSKTTKTKPLSKKPLKKAPLNEHCTCTHLIYICVIIVLVPISFAFVEYINEYCGNSWYFLLFAILGMGIVLQHFAILGKAKSIRQLGSNGMVRVGTTGAGTTGLFGISLLKKQNGTTQCNKSMIGKKCKCKWKSMKGCKYPCTISGSNADGSYSIDYDDGDKDYNVKFERLTFSNLSNLDKNVKKIKPLSMKKAKALFEKEFGKDKFYAWECELSGGIWTRYDDAASYGIESSYRNGTKHQLTQQYPTSTKVFQYTLTFAGDATGKQKNNETKVCRKINQVIVFCN